MIRVALISRLTLYFDLAEEAQMLGVCELGISK